MKAPENMAAKVADWTRELTERMERGRVEYGDKSFARDPLALIEEIRQELRDVANWAFIADCRMSAAADALFQQHRPTGIRPPVRWVDLKDSAVLPGGES